MPVMRFISPMLLILALPSPAAATSASCFLTFSSSTTSSHPQPMKPCPSSTLRMWLSPKRHLKPYGQRPSERNSGHMWAVSVGVRSSGVVGSARRMSAWREARNEARSWSLLQFGRSHGRPWPTMLHRRTSRVPARWSKRRPWQRVIRQLTTTARQASRVACVPCSDPSASCVPRPPRPRRRHHPRSPPSSRRPWPASWPPTAPSASAGRAPSSARH